MGSLDDGDVEYSDEMMSAGESATSIGDDNTQIENNCHHKDFRFGSGGFYIFCGVCHATWIACSTYSQYVIDYSRTKAFLTGLVNDAIIDDLLARLQDSEAAKVKEDGVVEEHTIQIG